MIVSIEKAIAILKSEGVVGMPTETVYGLAGRISSPTALHKIFSTKNRPFFDPLIVHVSSVSEALPLFEDWGPLAQALAEEFWPGPLTLVMNKNKTHVSDLITSGLTRVGVRCPNHPLALNLISKIGEPLAAPSANHFGKTSPTTAQHVESEFQGQIPVVDGGPCDVGIESTVLLIDRNQLSILRPGVITAAQITTTLSHQGLSFVWSQQVSKAVSPGHMKHHYMPSKPLFWIEGPLPPELMATLNQKLKEIPDTVEGVTISKPPTIRSVAELILPRDPKIAARELYSELRRLGESSTDAIVFSALPHHDAPEWAAILERLKKACSLKIDSQS